PVTRRSAGKMQFYNRRDLESPALFDKTNLKFASCNKVVANRRHMELAPDAVCLDHGLPERSNNITGVNANGVAELHRLNDERRRQIETAGQALVWEQDKVGNRNSSSAHQVTGADLIIGKPNGKCAGSGKGHPKKLQSACEGRLCWHS